MSIHLILKSLYIFEIYMNKRDLIFLNQVVRKLASPYFVDNDIYEYDRLQWATGVTKSELYKAVKLIEDQYKKVKE